MTIRIEEQRQELVKALARAQVECSSFDGRNLLWTDVALRAFPDPPRMVPNVKQGKSGRWYRAVRHPFNSSPSWEVRGYDTEVSALDGYSVGSWWAVRDSDREAAAAVLLNPEVPAP